MKKLKKFTLEEIQVCTRCGKVDVYKNDGHSCADYFNRQYNQDREWA